MVLRLGASSYAIGQAAPLMVFYFTSWFFRGGRARLCVGNCGMQYRYGQKLYHSRNPYCSRKRPDLRKRPRSRARAHSVDGEHEALIALRDLCRDTEISRAVGGFGELTEYPSRRLEGSVGVPKRTIRTETGKLQFRRAVSFSYVGGTIHASKRR